MSQILHRPAGEPPRQRRRHPRHRRDRRRRVPRLLVASAVAVALLAGASALTWQTSVRRYEGNVTRAHDVIDQADPTRSAKVAGTKAQNWLLVGSDSLAERGTTGAGPQRSDTVMVVHLAGDGHSVTVTSIPRDSWVDIPGHGTAKINAAFAYGGPRLLVRTVERLTRIRIDHYAAIDYAGFEAMTDAVGGVDVRIPKTVYDSANHQTWTKGEHHLDGAKALLYVRQRHGLPNGDLDRIRRQQRFLLALLGKLRSTGTLTNPVRLDDFFTAATKAVTVDDTVTSKELRALVGQYREIGAGDITFLVTPVAGGDRRGGQDVLLLDKAKTVKLFAAIGTDRDSKYVHEAADQP